MKSFGRRYRRNRNSEIQQKKQTPFFSNQPSQKGDNFFQAKLTIGQPGDQYEQEADKVASQVVNNQPAKAGAVQSGTISPVQSKEMAGPAQGMNDPEKEKEKAQTKEEKKEEEKVPVNMTGKEEDKKLQKQEQPMPAPEEKKKEEETAQPAVMKKTEPGKESNTDALPEQLQRKKGRGNSLESSTLKNMSTGIGADFSNVTIHTDSEAAQMNKELNAQAFTHGSDIYFNSGKYDPTSSKGNELLAHELTHVVQQNAAAPLLKNNVSHHTAATAIQKESSTPLPSGVKPDKKTKVAKFSNGGFVVRILPDKQAKKDSTEVKETGAVTNGKINARVAYKTEDGKVVSATITKELTIQTTYGSKAKGSDTSAYGRGTTEDDKKKGDTSLKFHEGNHGADFLTYIAAHPFPALEITEPLTQQEYDERYSAWEKEVKEYQESMEAESEKKTDKVGDAMQ
jgi:hypothetical protein